MEIQEASIAVRSELPGGVGLVTFDQKFQQGTSLGEYRVTWTASVLHKDADDDANCGYDQGSGPTVADATAKLLDQIRFRQDHPHICRYIHFAKITYKGMMDTSPRDQLVYLFHDENEHSASCGNTFAVQVAHLLTTEAFAAVWKITQDKFSAAKADKAQLAAA